MTSGAPVMSLDMADLSWSLAVGGGFAFFTSFGIGANDVANAFASSVGSGAVTYQNAVIIAAIFEFCGAVFLGSHVTGTIRKGIADLDQFCTTPDQLLIGMLSVIFCTGIWLILATHYELPVSTTHSCVGGVIGIAVMAKGWGAVHWAGVGNIVASWIVSPLLTGLLAAAVFFLVRKNSTRATGILSSQHSKQARSHAPRPVPGPFRVVSCGMFGFFPEEAGVSFHCRPPSSTICSRNSFLLNARI